VSRASERKHHNGQGSYPQAEEEGLPVLQGEGDRCRLQGHRLLRKFISDRGKIRARRVTGNCVQHQRDVAIAVKNAREMALLPYTSTGR
jgi:ribosomal protein S18